MDLLEVIVIITFSASLRLENLELLIQHNKELEDNVISDL